ncbi:MAG: DUF512 domain-containing protein, partial [Firmicutes bacterium]|nr:DUF512 domain-containing protein [Bacillota bacterium]
GDRLLAVNGHRVRDFLDYRFHTAERRLCLRLIRRDGRQEELTVAKDWDEPLGLDFGKAAFGPVRRCRNRCLFCFVDQLPPGLRPSLYVKDDDYRLSFWEGNFVTLTNLGRHDLRRIADLRLSPLYVSVHATNPDLRARMMGNPRAAHVAAVLKELAAAGIALHCQIVLCPGLNDGPELRRTVEDLAGLWPAVRSVGIVPVGLTRFREGLYPLRPVGGPEAAAVLELVDRYQRRFLRRLGTRLVFAADEFYFLAGDPLPPLARYEDLPQMENGIGLTTWFLERWRRARARLPRRLPARTRVALVTGELGMRALGPLVEALGAVENLEVLPVRVANGFFGPGITVAGLLTGRDVREALGSVPRPDLVLVPGTAVQPETGLFLDGEALEELGARLGVPVRAVSDPAEIAGCLRGGSRLARAAGGHCGPAQRG